MTKKSKRADTSMGEDPLAWMDNAKQDIPGSVESSVDANGSGAEIQADNPASVSAAAIVEDSDTASVDEASVCDQRVIELDESTGIAEVADIKKRIAASFAANVELTVDFSKAQRLDTAAMQLLMSAKIESIRSDKILQWAGINETIRSKAKLLNMEQYFD